MTTRYFNVKQGITTGNITLDATSGNMTGVGNLSVVNTAIANFFQGDGSSLSNITGGNVTGQVGNALVSGTVYSNAQPNITSVGSLTGLTSNGVIDLISASNVALGPVGNVHITGGSNGQVLQTDGTGVLSWVGISSTSISNGNSNVNVLGNGNVTISSAGNANVLVVTGTGANIAGTLDVTGNLVVANANLGNLAIANYFTGTLTTNAQPNITSVGTLSSLDVTGNITSGNVFANSGTIGASLLTGTLTTAAQPNITSVGTLSTLAIDGTGSVSGANLVSANYVTGTLTTNAQPNITSVGTLSSLDVTGNIGGGNINVGNANVTSSVTAGNIISSTVTAQTTADLTLNSGTGNANVTLVPTGTGTVNVSSKKITSLATPTADSDAATKGYVDSVAQGLDVKASVIVATTSALAAYTYNNGTSGVGATITADANGALTIDGYAVGTGDRVLVKNETGGNAPYNGIYVVTDAGGAGAVFVLTRSSDFDNGSPSGEIPAAFTFVEQGSANGDTGWVCTTNAPVTVGTTNIVFSQFSGAGQYVAGDGLTLTGTTFSVNVDSNTIVITSDTLKVADSANFVTPNIGTAGGTSLTASGNVSANNLSATNDVGGVSGTFSGNVSVGNLTTTGGISAATIAGNLTTATQANITSLGTLSNLTVSGTTSLGNVGNITITGGTANYYLQTNGSGNLTWAAVQLVAGSNTEVQYNNNGTFGASAAFTFNPSSNTLTATNIAGDGYGISNIAGANVTGNVANANLAGYVTQAAQSNITSVGSLTGLTSTGVIDLTGTSNVALGAVGNVHITGGSNGQYLKTDGSGGLSFATLDSASIANGNSSVSIPTANGNINLVADGNTTLVITSTGANVTGTLSATGNLTVSNANLGNLATANFFSGDGGQLSNITAGNITGQVANALVAGTVYTASQPNITSVGNLTSLTVSGNASANFVALNNGLTSNRSNVSVATNTVIDQFATATFRTAKYIVSASGDDGYQSVEALLVHDGSTAYITIYGSVCSNVSADIIDISANINGVSGNVSLYATSASPNAKVNIVASYINV